MPPIRAQNDLRRAADLGDLAACLADTGGLSVPPVWALYEARPLAFSPPLGFLPSLRCHAGVTSPPLASRLPRGILMGFMSPMPREASIFHHF